MTIRLTKSSAIAVLKGERQGNRGSVASGSLAGYVDWETFKACNFIGNLSSKAELFLYNCK